MIGLPGTQTRVLEAIGELIDEDLCRDFHQSWLDNFITKSDPGSWLTTLYVQIYKCDLPAIP